MSTKAIWSLRAKRSELGKAEKWQIYLSKFSIGLVVAFVLWLLSVGNIPEVILSSAAVFVTSKICYYLNTGAWPTEWDAVADWICDGSLHFGWLALYNLAYGDWRIAAVIFFAWLATYPWSCE